MQRLARSSTAPHLGVGRSQEGEEQAAHVVRITWACQCLRMLSNKNDKLDNERVSGKIS